MSAVEHRPECPGADIVTKRGHFGDTIRKCRGCGRVTVLTGDEATQAAQTLPPREPIWLPGPDGTDMRQAARRGDNWPTHRARRRNRRRRLYLERKAA